MDDIQIFVGQLSLSRAQSYFGVREGRWSAFSGLCSRYRHSRMGIHRTRSSMGFRDASVAWRWA